MDAESLRKVRNGGVVTSDIISRSHYQTSLRKAGSRWTQPLRFNK